MPQCFVVDVARGMTCVMVNSPDCLDVMADILLAAITLTSGL